MIFVNKLKATSKNQKAISGIYIITCLVNNKIYVGSSVDIYTRYHRHKLDLNTNKHHSSSLQNAWNKYGSEKFSFSILEFVDDKTKLIEREQFWMDELNVCDRKRGYNISPTAGNCLGIKHSEEMILANRLRQKSKIVMQFDLEGKLIKEWISIGELCRELNASRGSVSCLLKTKGKFKNKYYLFLKDEFTDDLLIECLNKKDGRKGRKCPLKNKKVNQYSIDGTLIRTWDSVTTASESLNVKHISECCKGKRNTAGGFVWKYAD